MPRKPKNAEITTTAAVETATAEPVMPPPAAAKKARTSKAKPPVAAATKAPASRTKKSAGPVATAVADAVSVQPTTEQVAHEAYLLWLSEGQPEGKDMEHWLVAEQIVRSRLSLLSAAVHTA